MNGLKVALCVGIGAMVVPVPGFAHDEALLVREVVVLPGNTVSEEGIIRGARALDPDSWATPADFPDGIPTEPLSVNVYVTLKLDAQGKVQSCGESDPPYSVFATRAEHRTLRDWAAVTCAMIAEKGRFAYAIDTDGTPVPSAYRMATSYRIKPEGEPRYYPPPAPWPNSHFYRKRAEPKKPLGLALDDSAITDPTPRTFLDIDTKGKVTRCLVWHGTGSDTSDAAVCRYLKKQKFTPAIDRNGAVVAEQGFRVDLPVSSP